MQQIVVTLVFSMVFLLIMAYPAHVVVEKIGQKKGLSQKAVNILTLIVTVILSLLAGIYLSMD